jgi:S1-C subfamily serine protease
MIRHPSLWALATLAALAVQPSAARAADDDNLDELQEKAIKAAVKKVAASVVKIETSGGTEVVRTGPARGPVGGLLRRGIGPTTGLIVSGDGYVISSAFNFANKPSTIRVVLPGLKERKVARVVATDATRMLTLLKIVDVPAGTKLPVPEASPKKAFEIGQTSIAVGRTLTGDTDALPSVSVGIISAIDRIWGKTIQSDAKISPTNYGGPLIDLEGRVQGVLVPASPQAEGELAGFEWYDSGIGFAVPLEDIFAVLPRMKKGTEKAPVTLKRGYLGVLMKSQDMFEAVPTIGSVVPGSAAEKAGIKPDDVVKAVDGKEIDNYAQMLHRLGSRYEGDVVSLKVLRGKETKEFGKIVLGSAESAYRQSFLGIVPVRDDPAAGVEVRYVYPKSPAETDLKLKPGDRIMKISSPQAPTAAPPVPITRGRDQLAGLLELARPGQSLKVEVKRKAGKTETLTVKLIELPDAVPDRLPDNRSAKKALVRPGPKPRPKPGEKAPAPAPAPAKKPETGLMKKTTPAADHTYWVYVPDNYDRNISYSVMVWLHPLGKNKEKDIEDFVSSWENFCDDNNIILVCPQSDNPRGWTPGEAGFVMEAVRSMAAAYTVDQRRIVAHGMGVGGEMALYLGFQGRSMFRGVATVAASLGSNPREKVPNQPLSFFLVVGGKDPAKAQVAATKEKLAKYKYPVVMREVANMGHEYIDGKAGVPTLEELVRWIDSLDRL